MPLIKTKTVMKFGTKGSSNLLQSFGEIGIEAVD